MSTPISAREGFHSIRNGGEKVAEEQTSGYSLDEDMPDPLDFEEESSCESWPTEEEGRIYNFEANPTRVTYESAIA